MKSMRILVATVLVVFGSVACASGPVEAEPAARATNTDPSSMERIREAVNQPEVTEALKDRGYSRQEIEHRLALLESNLSSDQKRYLAHRLAPAGSEGSRPQLPNSAGNRFLSTTLDLVTSIILLPIKIVAWFIPGL